MPPAAVNNRPMQVQFVTGFFFIKELQRCIAFKAYEYVCCQGKGLKKSQQHDLAYQKYHGITSHDSIGLAEKFMRGLDMFEGIYDGMPEPVGGDPQKVLKSSLHCTGAKIVSDPNVELKGINMTTLTANKKSDLTLISGRTIIDMGKKVKENGRKRLRLKMAGHPLTIEITTTNHFKEQYYC